MKNFQNGSRAKARLIFFGGGSDRRRREEKETVLRFFLRWVPKEHGSWAFLFEPVFAGLGIFPCRGGVWLALSCFGLFFLRLPVRKMGGIFFGRGWDREAGAMGMVLGSVVAGAFFFSGVWGRVEAFPFLAVAVTAGGVFFCADLVGKRREWWAECAGALAFDAFLPLAFILGGAPPSMAWWFFGARVFRSCSAVGMVRQVLRFQKEGDGAGVRKIVFSACAGWHVAGLLLWVGAGVAGVLPFLQLLVLQGFLFFRYAAFWAWIFLKKRGRYGGEFRVSPVAVGIMESLVGIVWVGMLIWAGDVFWRR